MASITNASKAYVSTGNGNAYSLIKNNYIHSSVSVGNSTLVWNDNNNGTATITGTIDVTGYPNWGANTLYVACPPNVSSFTFQSLYANGNYANLYANDVNYDGGGSIPVLHCQSFNYIAPGGMVTNVTINVSNVTYKKLNF